MAVRNRKTWIVGTSVTVGVLVVILITRLVARSPSVIRGAVVTSDMDTSKELPIGDVEVSVIGGVLPRGMLPGVVHSDASGYFSIPLRWRLTVGLRVTLRFRHPRYQPLDLPDIIGDQLYIAHLTPIESVTPAQVHDTDVTIAHVVAQYSINTTTAVNIGSAVKTFKVVNTGNVPCNGHRPCSPDGKWKAAVGAARIDAGMGNEFHNARASCIAGPCPFTRIDNNLSSSGDSQTLRVSALDWSDTATFLLEAEVFKHVVRDVLRQSYPVIFDRALTFTLPASAEGVSIQAELNRSMIVFPLGPSLFLSWANCQVLVNKDQTRVYRCELKPGYRFAQDEAKTEAILE